MGGYREGVTHSGILEVYRDSWVIHYYNEGPRRVDGGHDLRYRYGGRKLSPKEVEDFAANLEDQWKEAERLRAVAGPAAREIRKWLHPGPVEAIVSAGSVTLRIPHVALLRSQQDSENLASAFRSIVARIPSLYERVRTIYGGG